MNVEIDMDRVKEVRLTDGTDGRWHHVAGASFEIVGREQGMQFTKGDQTLRIEAAWAKWTENGTGGERQVFCPLTSVQGC